MTARTLLWLILAAGVGAGCALVQPREATNPAYIAAHRAEKEHWESLARLTDAGTTRRDIEQLLPKDTSLGGITGLASYKSKKDPFPFPHVEEWYYISPHFVCSVEYDFTGLKYEPAHYDATGEYVDKPEFPDPKVYGSDDSLQRALRRVSITLVEPRRVKKQR